MNYENASIYKICCNDKNITDCYVGSTTNFKQRKSGHKRSCNNENSKNHHIKVYQFIRENGGFDNWSMVLVEKVEVNDSYELKKKERKYIEELNSTLNCNIPTRTTKEWCEDNKEKIKEKGKEWRENNKETIVEKHKKYYQNNKETIVEQNKKYYEKNKKIINDKQKKYYEKNIEKNKEKRKEWRENNPEKIKEYQKEWRENNKVKIECKFCKSIVRKGNISTHQKTKKCLKKHQKSLKCLAVLETQS